MDLREEEKGGNPLFTYKSVVLSLPTIGNRKGIGNT